MTYAPLGQGIGEELNEHQTLGTTAHIPKLGTTVPITGIPDSFPDKVSGSRQSVLVEAQGLVHGDRNEQYGAPISEYTRTVGMVNAMLAHKLREPLAPEDLAYIMVCLKLSRQVNKPKRDSLVDAAGYCEVGQWILDAKC